MPSFQQNSVSATVWPWTQPLKAKPRSLGRVLLQVLIPYSVAAFLWSQHHQGPAVFVAGVGTVILLLGLLSPKGFAAFEHGLLKLIYYIGLGLTWILLIPLFFTFFLIASVSMRLKGKDPMARKLDPDATSYWIEHKKIEDVRKHYQRQF